MEHITLIRVVALLLTIVLVILFIMRKKAHGIGACSIAIMSEVQSPESASLNVALFTPAVA